MKIRWTIRTTTSLHSLDSEYSDTRHIADTTKTQLNEWQKTGWIRFSTERIVPWNAVNEISYFTLKEYSE